MTFRKFDGVKYRLGASSPKKKNIQKLKQGAINQGNKVRVIKSGGKWKLYERSKKGWEG